MRSTVRLDAAAVAPSVASRAPLVRLLVAAALVAAFGVAMKGYLYPYPIIDGDTALLVGGAVQLDNCLRTSAPSCPNVHHFPLMQYAEAVVLFRNGFSTGATMRLFTDMSAVAFCALLLLGGGFLWVRGRRASAAFFMLAMLSSYAVWHFNATFGEMPAALLVTALAAASVWRRSAVLLGVLAALCAITKETAAPFIFAFGALPLLRGEGPWRARLRGDARHLIALTLGIAAGVVANALFNDYRFGTFRNTYLLDPILQTPTLAQHALHFAGLWVSPNGGLLPFAPLSTLALAGLAVAGARAPHRLAAVAPFGLLVVLTVGFGRWFSPFGWWTWGPRLCLPWLPGLLLIALTFEGARLEQLAARLLRRVPVAVAVTVLVVAAALPHVELLNDTETFYGFFGGNRDCPRLFDVRGTQAEFYACHNAMIFPRHELLLAQAYGRLTRAENRLPLALYAALLIGLAWWLRRELRQGVDAHARIHGAAMGGRQ